MQIGGAVVPEVVHLSKVRVIQEKRPRRRAYIGDFPDPIYFGVHAGVAAFYKMTPEVPLPSTLDFLVAAAAGWLTGTLAGALEARGIPSNPDKLWTEAEGTIEAPEGVMKVTRIGVTYHLSIPAGKRAEAERALSVVERGCPVAQTLKGCVRLEYRAEIEEV
jgi:uncharacterized OsmC-like protein